jgi:hypothetical protein
MAVKLKRTNEVYMPNGWPKENIGCQLLRFLSRNVEGGSSMPIRTWAAPPTAPANRSFRVRDRSLFLIGEESVMFCFLLAPAEFDGVGLSSCPAKSRPACSLYKSNHWRPRGWYVGSYRRKVTDAVYTIALR